MATKEENEAFKAQFKQLRYQKQKCNVLKTWLSSARKSVQPWSCLNRGRGSPGRNGGNSCEKERSFSSNENEFKQIVHFFLLINPFSVTPVIYTSLSRHSLPSTFVAISTRGGINPVLIQPY